jgi:hypothetical protein
VEDTFFTFTCNYILNTGYTNRIMNYKFAFYIMYFYNLASGDIACNILIKKMKKYLVAKIYSIYFLLSFLHKQKHFLSDV